MNKKQVLFITLGGVGIACIAFLLGTTLPSIDTDARILNYQGRLSEGVNLSPQLHIAYKQYFLDQKTMGDTDSSLPIVSTLSKEGYLKPTFLNDLAKSNGVYLIYISPTPSQKNVSIDYLSEYGSIQINDTGHSTKNTNAN